MSKRKLKEVLINSDDWIDGFMRYLQHSKAPRIYRTWTAISTIASCLQRKCMLDLGLIKVYPNMYILLVGPSGVGKGTVMGPGLSMLREVPGVKLAAEAITREALVQELRKSSFSDVNPNTGEAYLHSSLTVYSLEFAVFLGYHNQVLMSDLSDWYDCNEHWTYRTKHQGTDELFGIWLNILGGTTPQLMQATIPPEAFEGGGLAGRMIMVFAGSRARGKSLLDQTQDEELRKALIIDLEGIGQLRGEYSMTKEFKRAFQEWEDSQEQSPPFQDDRFGGYMNRRPTHLIKLCMVCSASRSSRMVLELEDFSRGLEIIENTERNMPKVFAGFGKSDRASIMHRVAGAIALAGEVKFSSLLVKYYHDVDEQTLWEVVVSLATAGLCQVIVQETKGRGRDAIITYIPGGPEI